VVFSKAEAISPGYFTRFVAADVRRIRAPDGGGIGPRNLQGRHLGALASWTAAVLCRYRGWAEQSKAVPMHRDRSPKPRGTLLSPFLGRRIARGPNPIRLFLLASASAGAGNSHSDVGRAFQPAGSRGFRAPCARPGDWKVARTGRQECLPCALDRQNENWSASGAESGCQRPSIFLGLAWQSELAEQQYHYGTVGVRDWKD